jgi:hypothetical protein
MTRMFGLTALVAALAVGTYLFVASSRSAGPSAAAVTRAETQAESVAAAANFQAAVPTLQAWFVDHGTYAGATLTPDLGVVLVQGDARGYCLQTVAGAAVEHVLGPGGQPQAGPC